MCPAIGADSLDGRAVSRGSGIRATQANGTHLFVIAGAVHQAVMIDIGLPAYPVQSVAIRLALLAHAGSEEPGLEGLRSEILRS